MLSQELLKIICCPKCLDDLDYNEKENQLKCLKCDKIYKIENDIPILIIDDNNLEGNDGSALR